MTKLLPRYKRSTVYALIGVVFHFVVVVIPLLVSGGTGEAGKSAGWIALIFDFPLFFPFFQSFPFSVKIKFLIDSMGIGLYFSIFGSILYALVGWFIGYAMEIISKWRLKKGSP